MDFALGTFSGSKSFEPLDCNTKPGQPSHLACSSEIMVVRFLFEHSSPLSVLLTICKPSSHMEITTANANVEAWHVMVLLDGSA